MNASRPICGQRAFTLAEVLIASTVSLIMFGAILTATITLQRSYTNATDYSIGTADQQRAIDYISRDIRRAYTVTVSQSSQTLTLTVPDYYTSYDSSGNPTGTPSSPSISGAAVNYNDPTKPVTISYYIGNGQLLRQQTIGKTGAVSTFVVANAVESLQSQFADLTSIVTFSVTFAPDVPMSYNSNSQIRQATKLTASTSVRNARRD